MRPYQWVKNAAVLAPLIFSKKLVLAQSTLDAVAGFSAFCLASGCVYIFNDLIDRRADLEHPRKRNRPIASGKLPTSAAVLTILIIAPPTLTAAFLLNGALGGILLSYVSLNVIYTCWLKDTVIIDVFIIASGFFLRIVAGIILANAQTSEWVYVSAIFLTLFLGFSKRRAELEVPATSEGIGRTVLREYNTVFLDYLLVICSTGVILSYMLYTISDYAVTKFGTGNLVFTSVFVLYGLFRYLYLLYVKRIVDSPAEVLLTDTPLALSVILWASSCIVIIYL